MANSQYLTYLSRVLIHPSIAIAYCNLEFQALTLDTPRQSYVFNIGQQGAGNM